MLRHLRVKHPTEDLEKYTGGAPENSSISSDQDMETDSDQICSVEVTLEDGDSNPLTMENNADLNSAINGILEAAQGGPAGQNPHEGASDDLPLRRRRNKRSLIWRHYEHLEHLAAARCRICMKKIQCVGGGSTSNLHRHMSKRHPGVFSQLVANEQDPPPPKSSQGSNVDGDTSTPRETVGTSERRLFSGVRKTSRASEGEIRVFRREQELIEALRRAQREEGRALEDQKELLKKLRAADAREAAAERLQIESLRKAQQEEAKELSRQKEELQKEKAELQKKWEELQQERKDILLSSRGQQTS